MSLLAAVGTTVAVMLLTRPGQPSRRPAPAAGPARPGGHRRGGGVTTLDRAVRAVGRTVRTVAGRRPHPASDRRIGLLCAAVLAAVVVGPVPAGAAAGTLVLLGRARRLRRARRYHPAAGVERELPDVVDLLALAVGAGLSVPAAIPAIAPLAPPGLRADLVSAAGALAGGRPGDEVVVGLGQRWGPPARPLAHALADHLRYGTPVLPALERVAAEARAARRRSAETRARRLPVLLLLPLVLCTLPAFGLLTVAPLVAGTFDSLRGGHLGAPASIAPP